MRERNWRRAQRALAIDRARMRARLAGASSERWIRISATTPHPCSLECCGNPRRHGRGDRPRQADPRIDEAWD